jgi:hypothetical protein
VRARERERERERERKSTRARMCAKESNFKKNTLFGKKKLLSLAKERNLFFNTEIDLALLSRSNAMSPRSMLSSMCVLYDFFFFAL